MSDSVPYIDLDPQIKPLKKDLLAAFNRVLDKKSFILGPEVHTFEQNFAKFCGSKYVAGVGNGTVALHLAMKALGIGPGDEVITTPFTFAATCWAISYVGAKPVFVDIEEDYYNLDPNKIERAITKKTKAIIAVHLYGHPCDMDPIVDICNENKLFLVEDAAQAHGAAYKAQPIGTFGNISTYSFYPAKNLGAFGEGGAVTTNNKKLYDKVHLLRNHGSKERYIYDEVGFNYRMDGLQGALLTEKLKHLDQWNLQRKHIATLYHQGLEKTPLKLPHEAPWAESAYHLYSVAHENRDAIVKHLAKNNIGHSTHYKVPMHLQPCYKELGYRKSSLPVSEKYAREILNLPIFPGMKKKQLNQVVKVIKDFF